jgi:hypothetical protein
VRLPFIVGVRQLSGARHYQQLRCPECPRDLAAQRVRFLEHADRLVDRAEDRHCRREAVNTRIAGSDGCRDQITAFVLRTGRGDKSGIRGEQAAGGFEIEYRDPR